MPCCSHPMPTTPGQLGLHRAHENDGGCLFPGGRLEATAALLPWDSPHYHSGQPMCEVLHRALPCSNESTGFLLWSGSALRTNRGHSTHSVPRPQAAFGHRSLKVHICSPGEVTPCFYMAGGSSVVSTLYMRDPHNTCGWAPNP